MRHWNIRRISLLSFLLLIFLLVSIPVSVTRAGVLCDGVDDTIGTSAILSDFITASTGTLSAWIKPTGSAGADNGAGAIYYGRVIIADQNESTGFYRASATTDQLWAFSYPGSTSSVGTTFTNDTWIHLTWVHSSGTLYLYKDGVLVNSTAAGDSISSNVLKMCFDIASGTSVAYNGQLTAVTYYNVALSPGEIESLGKSRLVNPSLSRAVTGQWRFDQCSDGTSGNGVVFVDGSGSFRTATAGNGGNGTGMTCRASEYLSYQ